MLRLMLLRHAKSDWSQPARSDHERPLNDRGRNAAPLIGTYMAEQHLLPQHALVSTALRTRQTWTLVRERLGGRVTTDFEDSLYDASPHAILSVIRSVPDRVHTLIVVGHNPGLQELAEGLVGHEAGADANRMNDKFPTAALAVIDFDTSQWSALRPRGGRLERFVTPRSLVESSR